MCKLWTRPVLIWQNLNGKMSAINPFIYNGGHGGFWYDRYVQIAIKSLEIAVDTLNFVRKYRILYRFQEYRNVILCQGVDMDVFDTDLFNHLIIVL